MKWEFTRAQRIRTAASLIVVFLLIMATNLIDGNHFKIVQKSLTSMYEDRLLTKNYLYKISRQMQGKERFLDLENWDATIADNQAANDTILALMDEYARADLTDSESELYASLQRRIEGLFQAEARLSPSEIVQPEVSIEDLQEFYPVVFELLDKLSEIQLGEGRREMAISNRSIDNSNLIAKLEIGALIVIGLMLQVLIFVKPLK